MPTPSLTTEQKEINNILREKGFYTFTSRDFSSNPNAIKFLELHRKIKNKTVSFSEYIKYYFFDLSKNKYKKIQSSRIDIGTYRSIEAVKIIFGITNQSLAVDIADPYYEILLSQDEDGNYDLEDPLKTQINQWLDYCFQIDKCYIQYKQDKYLWQKNEKAYIKKWKHLYQTIHFLDDSSMNKIHFYINFLKSNYGLNQAIKAKADFLLSLELPNINSLKIAKKIIQSSIHWYQ